MNKIFLRKSFAGYPVWEYQLDRWDFYSTKDWCNRIHKDIVERFKDHFEEVKERPTSWEELWEIKWYFIGMDSDIGKTDGIKAADWGYGVRTSANGNTFMEVGNGGTSIASPTTNLVINTWYQIVGVWTNVASNSIAIYRNGSLVGSTSHGFGSIRNTSSPLYLGSFNGGQSSQWLNGRMGVVRMYSSALTASQILQNFNADKAKYGL